MPKALPSNKRAPHSQLLQNSMLIYYCNVSLSIQIICSHDYGKFAADRLSAFVLIVHRDSSLFTRWCSKKKANTREKQRVLIHEVFNRIAIGMQQERRKKSLAQIGGAQYNKNRKIAGPTDLVYEKYECIYTAPRDLVNSSSCIRLNYSLSNQDTALIIILSKTPFSFSLLFSLLYYYINLVNARGNNLCFQHILNNFLANS